VKNGNFKLKKIEPNPIPLVAVAAVVLAGMAILAAPGSHSESQASLTKPEMTQKDSAFSLRIDPNNLLARDIFEFEGEKKVAPKKTRAAISQKKIVNVSPGIKLRLVGVVWSSTSPVATLENMITSETYILSPGEKAGPAKLVSVKQTSVILHTPSGISRLKVWQD